MAAYRNVYINIPCRLTAHRLWEQPRALHSTCEYRSTFTFTSEEHMAGQLLMAFQSICRNL